MMTHIFLKDHACTTYCIHVLFEQRERQYHRRQQSFHTSPAATVITCGIKPCPALPATTDKKLKNKYSNLYCILQETRSII